MSVLDGPRIERRRVLLDGTAYWGTMDGSELRLDDGRRVDPAALIHLPPLEGMPSKIIAVHISYRSRSMETRNQPQPSATPTYFTKPSTALNGHNGQLVKPEGVRYLNYEGEYAAVIGRVTRNITPDEAWDHIAGFLPLLDMGAQDFRDTDQGSMLRVKGMDGFCPVGPGIVRGIDPRKQTLRTYRNGLLVQEAHIGEETIWGVDYLIADLARYITLMPGDIISTGTPAHSRSLDPGDVIEVEISNIGRLKNTVIAGPLLRASGIGHPPMDTPEVRRVALGCDERVREDLKANYQLASRG
ncbi:fumarylacetoacetate hydrolase family protein [Sphingomonas bacterium]|uniref:fumarylacetoacetate hydrolase family protein n=1 Tax=Sphingomonas bacterium TaxID=1895847 RepID=UPI0026154A2C|nr:fumarylacetoacetate hydrolase family protein [Sphingomonas bacterium]MDB5678283.1 5-carboxymethyl-2-hydroxymuconate isomerase [Sphingomonas bacterium]